MKELKWRRNLNRQQCHKLLNMGNETPIAVYNADKQQLVALFSSGALATKFIFGTKRPTKKGLTEYIQNRVRIAPCRTQHTFDIALRYANATQVEELSNSDCVLRDESFRTAIDKILRYSNV